MRLPERNGSRVNLFNNIVIPSVAVLSILYTYNSIIDSLAMLPIAAKSHQVIEFEAQPSAHAPMSMPNSPQQIAMRSRTIPGSNPRHSIAASLSSIEFSRSETSYQSVIANQEFKVSQSPVSTFALDVDNGGFSLIRSYINNGKLPPSDMVRTEEIINYFRYQYETPFDPETPFTIATETMKTPWSKDTRLLSIGVKGYSQRVSVLPPANLVFLLDTSGSMGAPDKLPLAKEALRILTDNLRATDRVSIVTYANGTQLQLPSTSGANKQRILNAIEPIGSSGGTAGEGGLRLAYQQAKANMIKDGNNRIILLTDGDFNVGLSSVESLVEFISKKMEQGVYLSTVGFGSDGYRDDVMEQLADRGNGIYFFIDSEQEARRVFERNLRSNLYTIARDVKIQVEFDPDRISKYRLIGYENRLLNKEDFDNDKVDAGEIGQGHTMTAIYELTLAPEYESEYLSGNADKGNITNTPLAEVRLRYKTENQSASKKMVTPVFESIHDPSNNMLLATAAAGVGEILRNSQYLTQRFAVADVQLLLNQISDDPLGEVNEFKELTYTLNNLMFSVPRPELNNDPSIELNAEYSTW